MAKLGSQDNFTAYLYIYIYAGGSEWCLHFGHSCVQMVPLARVQMVPPSFPLFLQCLGLITMVFGGVFLLTLTILLSELWGLTRKSCLPRGCLLTRPVLLNELRGLSFYHANTKINVFLGVVSSQGPFFSMSSGDSASRLSNKKPRGGRTFLGVSLGFPRSWDSSASMGRPYKGSNS